MWEVYWGASTDNLIRARRELRALAEAVDVELRLRGITPAPPKRGH
jgi:hypothetical protein